MINPWRETWTERDYSDCDRNNFVKAVLTSVSWEIYRRQMVKDTVTNSLPRSLLGFVGNVSGHGITQSLYTFLVKTWGITRQTSLYKCRLTIVNSEEVVSPGQREELKEKNLTSVNDAAASARWFTLKESVNLNINIKKAKKGNNSLRPTKTVCLF